MKQRIAVLGLGTMGMGMARNLLKAGFSVTAYNRTRAKTVALISEGADISDTPEATARDADVIISMLSDDRVSRQIWTGDAGALNAVSRLRRQRHVCGNRADTGRRQAGVSVESSVLGVRT